MSVDLGAMCKLAQNFYLSEVLKAYGPAGKEALFEVFEWLPRIYRHVDPDEISGQLLVFRALGEDTSAGAVLESVSSTQPTRFVSTDHLPRGYSSEVRKKDAIIQVCHSGELIFWTTESLDVDALAGHGVVYRYHARSEYVRVNGAYIRMPKPDPTYASVFAIPSFRNLKEALEGYKWEMVRTSQCPILSEAWDGGKGSDRLFFTARPEHIMRNSLTHYLKIVLREVAEVRPEQVVDESHPVDIKVTWVLSKKLALIEIKWLGKARNSECNITQQYYDSRAQEGAKQLADYLDANASQAPTHETKGYLVIVDARRYGLSSESTSVNQERGMYYADREIDFSPEYHKKRSDFEEPVRMFAEPICR